MANRQRHDSGVETESDESVTMSVESPRISAHQLDEGITDAPSVLDLPPHEVKVLEIPRFQQMDTEAIDENRPSTSRGEPRPGNSAPVVEQSNPEAPFGKMPVRHCRVKRHRLLGVYPKKSPRKKEDSALREAAASNDVERCRQLIENGADVRAEDSRRRTALHFAATLRGGEALVRLLLSKGANPNVQDVAGNTPLHLAICVNNGPVTRELLKYGSDLTALDRSGRNPIQLAKSRMAVIIETSRNGEVTDVVRKETLKMIQYLQEYLARRGDTSASLLGSFQERISASKTGEQFSSDVSDLLASLQHLQL